MPDIYQKTVERNLHETVQGLREHLLLSEIEDYNQIFEIRGLNFFSITYFSAFNSMMGHSSKILDANKHSHGFWYLYRSNVKAIKDLPCYSNTKITMLQELSASLKLVRDKTLSHIDRDAVIDSKKNMARREYKRKAA